MKSRKVWNKIFPLKIGNKVRYVKNLYQLGDISRNQYFGRIGEVVEFVEDSWKEHMIEHNCYPSSIRNERMFTVKFKGNTTWYAFRRAELRRVEDEET